MGRSDKTCCTVPLDAHTRIQIQHAETLTIDATALVEDAFNRGYRLGYGNGHHDSEHGEEYDPRPHDSFEMYVGGDLDDTQCTHPSEDAEVSDG